MLNSISVTLTIFIYNRQYHCQQCKDMPERVPPRFTPEYERDTDASTPTSKYDRDINEVHPHPI